MKIKMTNPHEKERGKPDRHTHSTAEPEPLIDASEARTTIRYTINKLTRNASSAILFNFSLILLNKDL